MLFESKETMLDDSRKQKIESTMQTTAAEIFCYCWCLVDDARYNDEYNMVIGHVDGIVQKLLVSKTSPLEKTYVGEHFHGIRLCIGNAQQSDTIDTKLKLFAVLILHLKSTCQQKFQNHGNTLEDRETWNHTCRLPGCNDALEKPMHIRRCLETILGSPTLYMDEIIKEKR